MSRLTKRVRSDVSPMILKLLNLEEVPDECVEVIGTDSKTCDEVCEENQCSSCVLSAVFEKLAHYEDLEEQGLLLELPCKVGDTVYLVCHKPTKCSKHQEYRDEYNCQGCEELYCDSRIEYYIHPIDSVKLDWIVQMEDCIGDTVFLTKEEAEAKLAELKGE